MQYFLAALCLIALISAGCQQGEDSYHVTNQYIHLPPDTTGGGGDTTHHDPDTNAAVILYPDDGATLDMIYHWLPIPPPYQLRCPWGFSLDSSYSARVVVHLASERETAQLYVRYASSQAFYPQNGPFEVRTDTFDVTFADFHSGYTVAHPVDSTYIGFYVRGTRADSSHWVTPIRSVWLRPRTDSVAATAPSAPVLDSIIENSSSAGMYIPWCLTSPEVDYILLSHWENGDSLPVVDSLSSSGVTYSLYDYFPSTRYTFQVFAGNRYGLSAGSNLRTITTHPLRPPSDLRGECDAQGVTLIYWANTSYLCDSILVARRELAGQWSVIAALTNSSHYPAHRYLDPTVTRHEVYYYRVAMALRGEVSWGLDSLGLYIR
jgi:hypothetical protein